MVSLVLSWMIVVVIVMVLIIVNNGIKGKEIKSNVSGSLLNYHKAFS